MTSDPWTALRQVTAARVALGRAGGSMRTAEVLAFAADHAEARDAVHSALDGGALASSISSFGLPVLSLRTRAENREAYLKCPDLGRRLDQESAARVSANASSGADVALIVGDGLSAVAGQRHAPSVLGHLLPRLHSRGFSVGPVGVVTQARVAVEDEIGALLKAKVAVILIGERPGLAAVDSLGAYLVHGPAIGKTDAQRNCISNIRPDGLEPAAAAEAIAWLVEQALARGISGVELKDDRRLAAELRKLD
jgi:ethanolamine ammonia-lyase small subunit